MMVYSATGEVIFDSTHRLGRILGRFSTGVSNGSYTYPTGFSGTLFASSLGGGVGTPGITVSGSTIYWTFGNPMTKVSTQVVYGCY